MARSPALRYSFALLLAGCLGSLMSIPADAQSRSRPKSRAVRTTGVKPTALPCGSLVGFQVLLDRRGFSPGEIDGKAGPNFERALSAFQETQKIANSGRADCDTWRALGGDGSQPIVATYTVTDADMAGPFVSDIPRELEQQAELPHLGYKSPLELIAERFHAAPALIEQMNPGVNVSAGQRLEVPAVEPFDPKAKPAADPAAGDLTIQVSRTESAMRATRADGTLVFFAPVTSGSQHDPLPPGNWKVTAVSWLPTFHYNPDLFWDAKATDNRATLKPGPNNPVGVVWVDINIEHYGMHGTPEPSNVGHTQSHGCVRFTNWDAARLASLVKPGTPVIFK